MTKHSGASSHPTFHRLTFFFALLAGLFLASGCSLIKVEAPNEPIPTDDMNVRLSTNDFAVRFAETVEHTADTVLAGTTDLDMQLNALRWKINAFGAIRHASFRPAPIEALVDTWVLTTQMAGFFRIGAGSDLFGEWQEFVVEECDSLQSDITVIAMVTRSPSEFAALQDFVTQEARQHPLPDLSLHRQSAVPHWRKFAGIADSVAVSTVGTLPQALTQMGTGLLTVTEHTPKEARWNVELARKKSRIESLQLAARLDRISSLLAQITLVAQNSPEVLGRSIDLLGLEFEAALRDVDMQRSATLIALAE
jgi:hypothetical protein